MIIRNYLKTKFIKKNFEKIFEDVLENIDNPLKTLNVLNKDFAFKFKTKEIKKYNKFKKLAIIGMGGSILGSEAIYCFFKKKIKKKIYFFDDLDENKILDFKKKEKFSEILFIIISKSGNTIETLSNTFSLNIIKKNAKNVIIISEKKNNLLFQISKKFNLFFVEHNNYIGGRYSVLSEVGMIPAYLMGIKISELRSEIKIFLKGLNKEILKESSTKLAYLLNFKKKNNLIFLNYSPELDKFLFWCQQLIAESLGKRNRGFLPIISNVPKDHHSLLQLYLDGPKDKIFYIFSTETKSSVKIKIEKSIDKKNILNQKSLNFIKKAQKNALIKTLNKNKLPYREFILKKNNASTLGKFFSYFILETIIVGKLSKINPYDQPAVEQVKKYTNQILNLKNQR